jgi:hypothetical protein
VELPGDEIAADQGQRLLGVTVSQSRDESDTGNAGKECFGPQSQAA